MSWKQPLRHRKTLACSFANSCGLFIFAQGCTWPSYWFCNQANATCSLAFTLLHAKYHNPACTDHSLVCRSQACSGHQPPPPSISLSAWIQAAAQTFKKRTANSLFPSHNFKHWRTGPQSAASRVDKWKTLCDTHWTFYTLALLAIWLPSTAINGTTTQTHYVRNMRPNLAFFFFFKFNTTLFAQHGKKWQCNLETGQQQFKGKLRKREKKKRCTICIIRHLIPVHCLLSSSDSLLNLTYASFHYEKTFQPLALDELIVAGHFLSRMLTEDSQLLECIHATYVHVLAMQSCKCQQTHNEM